jgi:WD domain, G-beta repeat
MSWRCGRGCWPGRTRRRCGAAWTPLRPGSRSPPAKPPWPGRPGQAGIRAADGRSKASSLLQAASDAAAQAGADPARHPPLGQTETDFLHASGHAHRRRSRRRHAFVAFLMALIIGLASVAVVAIRASLQAAHQRDILDGAVSALVLIHSKSLRSKNPALSTLLGVAAWRIHPSNAARYAMLTAAAQPGTPAIFTRQAVGSVYSVALSRDGTTLASGSADNAVTLWNVAKGRQIRVLRGSCSRIIRPFPHLRRVSVPHCHSGPIYSVVFSPDGTSWSPAAPMAHYGTGTSVRTSRSGSPSRAPPYRSPRWRSARIMRPGRSDAMAL